ncbi:MAG: protein translocase subunit SecF [Acidobacteriia bacterium]|nr:protein translocase subunit SecF [Terriglobia bacterium]
MELFKSTNYDFLGYKWPFICASLVLSVAGVVSLLSKGGPRYGIDFKGGMVMTVRFAGKPPIDEIRSVVSKRVGEVSVQTFEAGSNEVAIGTGLTDARQLDQNRRAVVETLDTTFGQPASGKLDFNNASHEALVSRLLDALARNSVAMSDAQLQKLVADMLEFRNTPPRSGLITSFDQLSAVPGVAPAVINTLKQECYLAPFSVRRGVEMVGPQVGADLRQRAIWATLAALGGMLVYIAFRFEWIYGVAAVVACFHDTIITIGFFSLFNKEITMTVIAALLTLVGYSMNDTIVIFDRIRENLKLSRREPLEQVINRSVNQTLSRTVMTSGLTFLTVIALFLFGGPVLHGFSFALVVGIIIGTYSSVFVASPIVLFWHNWFDERKRTAVLAAPAKISPAKEPASKGSVRAVK